MTEPCFPDNGWTHSCLWEVVNKFLNLLCVWTVLSSPLKLFFFFNLNPWGFCLYSFDSFPISLVGSEQGWVGFSCLLELNHDPDQNWYDLYNKENFKIICINTNHSILSAEGFPGGSRKNSLYRQVFKYIFLFSNFWDTGLCLKQTLGLSVIKSYNAITCLIVQPVRCTQLAERNLYLSAYIRDLVLNQNLYNCCAIYCSLPIIMYILG